MQEEIIVDDPNTEPLPEPSEQEDPQAESDVYHLPIGGKGKDAGKGAGKVGG